ncbi:AraC family transcriptional regulator [Mucilaginibacter sp. CAU 1740]|uniref:AraC family transcriptional regulator n=1 Tax=Mucilaginibacter sp. CAU 1740 TaxID=3140365 RepID=UPI00325C083B
MKKDALVLKYCPPPGDQKQSLLVDHVRIPPNEQITFHQHDALEISYIIKGSGTRVMGNTMQPFLEGEIVFIPSNVPHCWSFDEYDTHGDGTIENISIFFLPELLDAISTTSPQLYTDILKIKDIEEAIVFNNGALKQMQIILRSMTNEGQFEQLASLFRLLSVIALTEDKTEIGGRVNVSRNDKRMQKAYSFVINNFQNPVTLEDVAIFVGMDRSSFCTFFKKMTGKSFFTFLNEYRIESSIQMLQKTTLTVAEICNATGFNDIPYFNRVFKKIKQTTPTAYRSSNYIL